MNAPTKELSASKLPCHNCGYDLRAHPPDGKCPECEASVADSRRLAAIPLRPAWRDSDPRWRRRMLAGVWLLVFLPLMDVVKEFEWGSSVSVPAVFEFGGNSRKLQDTLLCNMRVYQMVVFCMGVVLLFSKERGRRRSPWDWTRRWGVICSYVASLLSAVQFFYVIALVLAGIAACFLSMPPKYQPQITQTFINVSAAWLGYGLYPKVASLVALVAFSSITILLACISLFDALRSSGPKWLAAMFLAPLALFSMMRLAQVGAYYFGSSGLTETDLNFLGMYFQPELLVSPIAGHPTEWEAAKWCSMLGIALWLTIAQISTWRQRKNATTS